MQAIELRAVTKTYPGTAQPAVASLSLAVSQGALVTLLGPSGSGKTTVLRLIAGFERADAGEILLTDRRVSGPGAWVAPERRGVGMVFQDYALFPHLTVARNVGFGYRGPDQAERIREVLELVALTGYETRYPHELSGGQQQRVALARALARRPVVVLLDEPFSNLDAALRTHMRLELRRILKAAGATALLVSHDQADALAISDRIVVLKGGTIQQVGSPQEIYQRPANRFVATFVGQSNLLAGVVDNEGAAVITDLGVFACRHDHAYRPGERVYACIRPDSLEMVPELPASDDPVQGTILSLTYTGQALDAVVEVRTVDGSQQLLVRLPSAADVREGQVVALRVAPEAVALVGGG